MVGDPPIQGEGFLALREDFIFILSFGFELGMPFYQGGWNHWACLGTKVLIYPFLSYESWSWLCELTEKLLQNLVCWLPGAAEVLQLSTEVPQMVASVG